MLRWKQSDIVPIICHQCHWQRWQIYSRCCWNRWQFANGINDTSDIGGKFTVGVNDTGGKFATGVVDPVGKFVIGFLDTGGKYLRVSLLPMVHLDLRIFPRIFEKIMTLMLFSGARGKMIHGKKLKQKILWHCPFNSTLLHLPPLRFHCDWGCWDLTNRTQGWNSERDSMVTWRGKTGFKPVYRSFSPCQNPWLSLGFDVNKDVDNVSSKSLNLHAIISYSMLLIFIIPRFLTSLYLV